MDLKYVVLTIIKILISVPTIFFLQLSLVSGDGMMGGHLDNKNFTITNTTIINNTTNSIQPQNITTIFNLTSLNENQEKIAEEEEEEEVPDPSALVLPGYNLPDNIFNKGKPFYLEKDPLTGKIDFESASLRVDNDDNMYEYIDDEEEEQPPQNFDIYNKANIDRKDGSLNGHHKPSDVNQLTPNFHDFLNLPVKYNSDKYVYPLISSSYANTKIQGNVNKYHNHKDYGIKSTTQKPTISPTYFNANNFYSRPKSTVDTTTTSTTTEKTTERIYLTTNGKKPVSFHEDFEDYYDLQTGKPVKNYENVYLTTTKAPITTTTKHAMSLIAEFFGYYDEVSTERPKPPPLFQNLPNRKNGNNNKIEIGEKPISSSTTTVVPHVYHPNSHAGAGINVDSEEYRDDYSFEDEEIINSTTSSSTTAVVPTTTTTKKIEEEIKIVSSTTTTTTTEISTTPKVTSLPLGENHVTSLNNRQPIIVATQNIREKLNSEKVEPKPFGFEKQPVIPPPSTSNIHIAPDQDTVSFVVGHHQNVDGGGYVGTSLKESPYDSNPFRPLYGQQQQPQQQQKETVSYSIVTNPGGSSAVTIQPQKNNEASLAIGVPLNQQVVPGQVVDAELELSEKIEFPKVGSSNSGGSKIVFPDEKDVLKLNSKPMYHQLPSDLTPPKEKEILVPPQVRKDRPRPPWDPRPGHFYSGKPEYARPPRPHSDIAYKRIDNLPNILPQFRPNMKNSVPHHPYLNRQPLLDRPSNRPIGFFEKLQPPPPPKNLHNLRKLPPPPPPPLPKIEDRILNEVPKQQENQFHLFPPKVVLAQRRIGSLESDVETLQMIQAKKKDGAEIVTEKSSSSSTTDKPLYVVYPVNTPPIKLDIIDSGNKKESVVIGTRAELPLPPSKITGTNTNFDYEQNPILNPKDRNDAPILKPHPRPPTFPIKSDFPYPLERPDPSVLTAVPDTNNNKLEEIDFHLATSSNNQWNTIGEEIIESRVVNKPPQNNQISVTLKTYTEKPIAVAYTPTEPQLISDSHRYDFNNNDRYSMPNYGSPVIPEIRPGEVPDTNNNEFTVSAVMHTHPQQQIIETKKMTDVINHKNDDVIQPNIHQLDFQAPFQASVSVDSVNQGWSVVKSSSSSTENSQQMEEVTTLPLATTSEFDIENFKPQLIGGFKPIYSYPDESGGSSSSSGGKIKEDLVLSSEREE